MLAIYDTPREIIQAHGGTMSDAQAIRGQIDQTGCWGFLDENGNIHIFYNDNATKMDLMDLVAHELTHDRYDKMTGLSEEETAMQVGEICARAAGWLQKLGVL